MTEPVCLKCGEPYEDYSYYKEWKKDENGNPIAAKMFIHKSHITNFIIPMRHIDEECFILETDDEWEHDGEVV